ncbi:MAG: transglycosylase SLT domain-containing protein [Deltaproteobacteria bacterium]|nr:transglycosylase SLT domain-containing protein [Deltaproteobacteria bacterium]
MARLVAFITARVLVVTVVATLTAPAVLAQVAGPDERERKAVRGGPLEESLLVESPELRELRSFESRTFGRTERVPFKVYEPEQTEGPVPPAAEALKGRWSGSGDVPAVLRSPAHDRGSGAPEAPESNTAWLSSLTLPEIPVRWHSSVLKYLDFFKTDDRGRAIMTNWLRRLGRYRPLFDRIAARENVPRDLIFLAMVESGFEPGAVSHVGAGGVWQFMPGAGRAYGLEVSYWVDNRRDPERAAEAAARYLKDLYARFGSWPLAFAAYNAGYGAVLRSITRYNTNDYWELIRHEAGLPWETALYVPKILACAVVGNNVKAFGFENVPEDPPLLYDVVEVPAATSLERVAKAAGVAIETVESLNPELIRGRTPPDRGTTLVRVPEGGGELFARNFHSTKTKADQLETVVLRFGESLDDLAKARGVPVRELRKINGLKDSRELVGGTPVLVPVVEKVVAKQDPKQDLLAEKIKEASAPPVVEPVLVAVPEREFRYEGRERVFYQTKSVDTLEDIAAVFAVSPDNLTEWNNLDAEAKLQEGMVLQLFVPKDFDRGSVALLDPARLQVVTLGSEEFLALRAAQGGKTRLLYKAKAGDTLAKIARRYGLKPNDLARINRLSYNSNLQEGQDVVVYSPTPEMPREYAVGRTAPGARRPGDEGHVQLAPKKDSKTDKTPKKAQAKNDVKADGKSKTASGKDKTAKASKTTASSGAATGKKSDASKAASKATKKK